MIQMIKHGICAPLGYTAGAIHAGIRKNKEKKDLALIVSEVPAAAAAIYTTNLVKGAPILVTKRHLQNGVARAILVNSGNANTCNPDGEQIAEQMSALCAAELGIETDDIIIASTGVIGQALPIEPIAKGMAPLVASLQENGSLLAAEGMMTTDTYAKECAVEFYLGEVRCKIGGIAKGSGMIHPDMATMLCFLTSDVNIAPELLQTMVKEVADDSFHMISVDGDTSTNDTFAVMCNGLSGNACITERGDDYRAVKQAMTVVATELAKMLAADGEGATKLITCQVTGAFRKQDAVLIAKSVIHSNLFKCAMFGRDANWGRILCAIGYSKANVSVEKIDVTLVGETESLVVCQNGYGVLDPQFETGFDEAAALRILSAPKVTIAIALHDGDAQATAWGCDLTYDYVKINGEYRS